MTAGAPTKLDQEMINKVTEAIGDVLVIRQVAGLVGVHYTSIYNWLAQGEKDIKENLVTDSVKFFYAVKAAQSKQVKSLVADIKAESAGWQRYAWLLERCFREDFGQDNEKIKELMDKQEYFESKLDHILSNPIQGRLNA